MKRFLFVLFFYAIHVSAIAQAPTEKTLLWRISGKGLSQPSYLYGTMHLPDDRLFNFSDSLLRAIEKTEGFAIEVDPDELMTVVMEQLVNDEKKSRLLRDVVSKKAYTKYAPMLAKRLKKPAAGITVKDVVQEQNKWMQEAYSKGSMPTFVDVWLYDVARKQGKWVGGIEDIQDQAGLMEDVFNEQDLEFLTADYSSLGRKYLDKLVGIYEKEDIQGIDEFSNDGDGRRKDLLLLRRNVKMARRMDSLSAIRTMVFAVGAAHLPGDSGVISLLRKNGFSVEAVFSPNRIAGKDYKVVEKPMPWVKTSDTQGLYEVEMPGKANMYKMYGVVEMRMNINLFTSSGYMMMAVPTPENNKDADVALLTIAQKMMENEKLKQGTAIEKNGMKGREYISKDGFQFKRAQLFTNGKVLYAAYAFFTKEENLNGADAAHFFGSLQLYEPKAVAAGNRVAFTGIMPGIVGEAPMKLEPNKEMAATLMEKGYDTRVFTGVETTSGAVYMFISKGTQHDTYIQNDSLYLNAIRENNRAKSKLVQIDTMKVESGMYRLEQKGIYQAQQQVTYHLKSYMQGNRCYTYFAIVPQTKESEETARQFMQNFKVVKPASDDWTTQPYEGRFATWAPAAFIPSPVDTTEDENNLAVNSRDTLTSYVYSILSAPFDTAVWYNSKADYWKAQLKMYDTDEDTVVQTKPFTANGLEGYDLEVKDKSWQEKSKLYRLFTYGDTLYTLFACVPVADANQPDVRRFFTDIRFTHPTPAATIFTSKAVPLIARLSSADSAARDAAYSNLYSANFAKPDIPLLHQALLQHYSWDTADAYFSPLQLRLGEKLQDLEDSTLADFIKAEYPQRNGRDDEEQTSLLNFVVSTPTQANLKFVLDALQAIDSASVISYRAIYHLDDSLLLAKQFAPEILRLLNKINMVEEITDVVQNLLDSNVVQPADVLTYQPALLRFGKSKLTEANKEKQGYGYALSSVAIVAGRLRTPASLSLLQQMTASRHNAVKMQGVYGLLEADAPIQMLTLQTIAADYTERTALLEALREKNKEVLFPKQYKTQPSLGEAALYDYISEDDGEPTRLLLLTVQKTTLNGKPANVYFYKCTFKGEEETTVQLGAVAFPADAKLLEPLPYGTAVLWDEEYKPASSAKQMKQLLEKLRENMKGE